jgi:hypothetical protein
MVLSGNVDTSTNKTDIAEILLKVVLNTIAITLEKTTTIYLDLSVHYMYMYFVFTEQWPTIIVLRYY